MHLFVSFFVTDFVRKTNDNIFMEFQIVFPMKLTCKVGYSQIRKGKTMLSFPMLPRESQSSREFA